MIYALIAAAGSGRRMGACENKIFLSVNGKPIIKQTVDKFLQNKNVDAVALVCAQNDKEHLYSILGDSVEYVLGGATRGESVFNGLKAIAEKADKVLIHDGARPFVDDKTIDAVIESISSGIGAVAGIKAVDTIKQCTKDGFVIATPSRESLWQAQTPQGFICSEIFNAYKQAGFELTDDAAVFEEAGGKIKMVLASAKNKKITTKEDLQKMYLSGIGFDVHQLVEGRKLILGGVEIPHTLGLLGHSDADVLLHAICDALLAAAGQGDIGKHFPDTDPKYKGISSLILLKEVYALLTEKGFKVVNVSAIVAAQRPKLAPYISQMNKNIAEVLELDPARVNVAATTTEHLGFEGEEKGISARAVVSVVG